MQKVIKETCQSINFVCSNLFDTYSMAADQRRKRLISSGIVGCNSREQSRSKSKNFRLPKNGANLRSHISLKWDGYNERVVAKRNQISISWRNLRQFLDSSHEDQQILADVFTIPEEIFELASLTEVISHEVWQTCLSENERLHLSQFLPEGSQIDQVVRALLSGENLDFGNPFLTWGSTLCSGGLHPDAVLHQERSLRANKSAYLSNLQKYHHDKIEHLQKIKETCENRRDPGKEIELSMWRSSNEEDKAACSLAYEYGFRNPGEFITTLSESCSWAEEEKAWSSDDQSSVVMQGNKLPRRKSKKLFDKDMGRNVLITSDDMLDMQTRPQNGDMLCETNVCFSDGTKYMSFLKISKKQHDLVKNMKQSGKSVLSRSLKQLLGNIEGLQIQPYKLFLEEEQKKLHQHWLLLVKNHLPIAYANWREIHLQRRQMIKSLEQDIVEGQRLLPMIEKAGNQENLVRDQDDSEWKENQSAMEGDDKSFPSSPSNQTVQQVAVRHKIQHADLDSFCQMSTISTCSHLEETVQFNKMSSEDVPSSQGLPDSSAGHIWRGARVPNVYYASTAGHGFTSSHVLPRSDARVDEAENTQLIDPEPDLGLGSSVFQRQADSGSLCCYQSQDKNELLQSLFKSQVAPSFHGNGTQAELPFQSFENGLMAGSQYPRQFQEQRCLSLSLEQGQRNESEIYIPQNLSDNFYLAPGGEHLSAVNMPDWGVNPVCLPAPLQSPVNGENLLGKSWLSREQQVPGIWPGSDGADVLHQSISSGSSGEHGLLNVLSQCKQAHSSSMYHMMSSTERFMSSVNYATLGEAAPCISAALPQASSHLLDEAVTSFIHEDMGWMGMQGQNSTLNDHMQKPYLRSWNQ